MQIDFFRYTRPFIKVKCETAVRRQHLEDCVLQRRWAKLWLVRGKNSVVSSSALTLVVNLLIGLSFFCCIITVTKQQSTTQDSIGGRLLRLSLGMNRCIYCDVNVKCCAIICRDVAVGAGYVHVCLYD